ncbi:uncharacterized protein TNCV_1242451 [Trichonephila clavipes]|nr:uncharacterized protein TNCV_1242451 [Trichonephila clavipes]
MPPNTLRVHTEYVLVKSVGPKVLFTVAAETTSAGSWRIFPSPPVLCLNCGGGDRWCRHSKGLKDWHTQGRKNWPFGERAQHER